MDMKKLIEGTRRDLKAEEYKQKDELHTLGDAVDDRWLVVDAKAHDQTKAANATLGLAESVGDQIDADHSKSASCRIAYMYWGTRRNARGADGIEFS